LKHGPIVLFATFEHDQNWDNHLPRILFGYRCGIWTSIKISPHMTFTRWSPRLKVDNFLNSLVSTFDDGIVILAEQMIENMQLITKMHG
jgi:hypothetical protein